MSPAHEVFSPIKRKHILDALKQIDLDREGIPPGRNRTNWLVQHEGRIYPPKYVLSVASSFAEMEPLKWFEFYGGQPTNSYLKGLGFEIIPTPAYAARLAQKAAQ